MQKPYLVGVVSVLTLVLALGCSSSSSDRGKAAVDPAAEDFCLHWANGVCRLAYLCVDASAQDAAFHARYGNSQGDCWQSVEPYCTSNQSGSQSFGPGCGPGKKLNQDLASACTLSLDSETCAEWQAAPGGVACQTVCSSASDPSAAGGAGGSGSPGGTGGGGGSGTSAGSGNASSGSLPNPKDFCLAEGNTQCDRIFECAPELASQLGTLADCKASTASDCAAGDYCKNGYDAAKAARCVSATKSATCDALKGTAPADCLTACP